MGPKGGQEALAPIYKVMGPIYQGYGPQGPNEMLSLQSFPRKGVSLGYVGRIIT